MGLNTPPVLFLVFNRLSTTKQVFEAIKKAKPSKLFIAADGPRNKEEAMLCCDIRKWILSNIDWLCEVKTLFSDKNLGCGRNVDAAITWFFSHVEEGIILEDDTLPTQSFFIFCRLMLQKYRHTAEIMMVSGNNFQKSKDQQADYYFSSYPLTWGWATWKRAWELNDNAMTGWKQIRTQNKYSDFWAQRFDQIIFKQIDTWDYQWHFTVFEHNGISIIPQVNLVDNIGFGSLSTHTNTRPGWYKKANGYNFSTIRHPEKIEINYKSDRYYEYIIGIRKRHFLIVGLKTFARKLINLLTFRN